MEAMVKKLAVQGRVPCRRLLRPRVVARGRTGASEGTRARVPFTVRLIPSQVQPQDEPR